MQRRKSNASECDEGVGEEGGGDAGEGDGSEKMNATWVTEERRGVGEGRPAQRREDKYNRESR